MLAGLPQKAERDIPFRRGWERVLQRCRAVLRTPAPASRSRVWDSLKSARVTFYICFHSLWGFVFNHLIIRRQTYFQDFGKSSHCRLMYEHFYQVAPYLMVGADAYTISRFPSNVWCHQWKKGGRGSGRMWWEFSLNGSKSWQWPQSICTGIEGWVMSSISIESTKGPLYRRRNWGSENPFLESENCLTA